MITKTNSFQVVRSISRPSLEIVLTHGSTTPRKSIRQKHLERWVKQFAKEYFETTARASCFSFDANDVLVNGTEELETVSLKLLSKIRILTESRRKENSGKDLKPFNFLFISHGLGAWVVKNVLARLNSLDLSFLTVGVVCLDDPNIIPGSIRYGRYLDSLTQESLLSIPDRQTAVSELSRRLQEIDENWWELETSELDSIQQYNVWIVDFKMEELFTKQKSRRSEIRRMVGRRRNQSGELQADEAKLREVVRDIKSIISHKNLQSIGKREASHPSAVTSTLPYQSLGGRTNSFVQQKGPTSRSSGVDSPGKNEANIEFSKTFESANLYFQLGDLDLAEDLYRRSEDMVVLLSLQGTDIHFRVSMWRVIVSLQKGEYIKSGLELERMRDILVSRNQYGDLKDELDGWLSVSLLRQGQYQRARDELERLLQRMEKPTKQRSLQETERIAIASKLLLGIASTRRLLALASAYLGHYTDSFHQIELLTTSINNLASSQPIDDQQKQWRQGKDNSISETAGVTSFPTSKQSINTSVLAIRNNSKLTEAIVLMLWGNYRSALKASKSALEELVKQWGKIHIRSLEAASLNALLLAYNSDIGNAEVLCIDTLETMTSELGNLHPLTLETMDVLVYIFRSQARFVEAIDTASSLCEKFESSLGMNHRLTFQSKSQLAAAHISCGNYLTAERILKTIESQARNAFGDDHPQSMYFRSQLALAYCYSWDINMAEELALDVLGKQRRTFSMKKGKQVENGKPGDETRTEFYLQDLINDIKEDIDTLWAHPDLLFTLQVLAKIESKKPKPNFALLRDIFETVLERRKVKLGASHVLTLISESELAGLCFNLGDIQKGLETMHHVVQERTKILKATHPDTLAARYELFLMTFNPEDEIYLPEIEEILVLQRRQIGPGHPDTLRSLSCMFAIRLIQENYLEAHKISSHLLYTLSQDFILDQRIFDSLQLIESIALLYAKLGRFEFSIPIFCGMLKTIEDAEKTEGRRINLKSIKVNIKRQLKGVDNLDIVKQQALLSLNELSTLATAELGSGAIQSGDEIFQLAFDICESFYYFSETFCEVDRGILSARLFLARSMFDSGIIERMKQALEMVSEMVAFDENVIGEELFNDLDVSYRKMSAEFTLPQKTQSYSRKFIESPGHSYMRMRYIQSRKPTSRLPVLIPADELRDAVKSSFDVESLETESYSSHVKAKRQDEIQTSSTKPESITPSRISLISPGLLQAPNLQQAKSVNFHRRVKSETALKSNLPRRSFNSGR